MPSFLFYYDTIFQSQTHDDVARRWWLILAAPFRNHIIMSGQNSRWRWRRSTFAVRRQPGPLVITTNCCSIVVLLCCIFLNTWNILSCCGRLKVYLSATCMFKAYPKITKTSILIVALCCMLYNKFDIMKSHLTKYKHSHFCLCLNKRDQELK